MFDTTTEARAGRWLREEGIVWLTTVRSDGFARAYPVAIRVW